MPDEKPAAPNQRTFSLNSRQFYEAACERRERPRIPNGALPREPRWPRKPDSATVWAESDDEASRAFREWQRHVEAGRI